MTRLTEALERARAIPATPETSDPAKADPVDALGIPSSWLLDGEEARGDAHGTPGPEPVAAAAATPVGYRFSTASVPKLVVSPEVESVVVEQYRRFAALLHHAQADKGTRTVMVTSAVASEGKTLTATNLALTLSHSYQRRVLLIDADLRRPSLHEMFQLPNDDGLGRTLRNPTRGHLPLHQISPTLWVLTAGRPVSDPTSSLVSPAMKQLIFEAAGQFDWVILDTPPVALLSDANLLASMIDTAVIVVGASTTPYPLVKRAIDAVGAQRVLGIILNRTDRSAMVGQYGYYYGYGYGRPARSEKPA